MRRLKRVEVVQFFLGERDAAQVIGRAQTLSGVRRLVSRSACWQGSSGWGVEVRGSAEALEDLGAIETAAGLVIVFDRAADESVTCVVE